MKFCYKLFPFILHFIWLNKILDIQYMGCEYVHQSKGSGSYRTMLVLSAVANCLTAQRALFPPKAAKTLAVTLHSLWDVFLLMLFSFHYPFVWDRVLLCVLGWSWTHGDLPASGSGALRVQACITMPGTSIISWSLFLASGACLSFALQRNACQGARLGINARWLRNSHSGSLLGYLQWQSSAVVSILMAMEEKNGAFKKVMLMFMLTPTEDLFVLVCGQSVPLWRGQQWGCRNKVDRNLKATRSLYLVPFYLLRRTH